MTTRSGGRTGELDVVRAPRWSASFVDLQAASAAGDEGAADALASLFLDRLTAFAKRRGAVDPDGIADVALINVLRRLDQVRFDTREQMWAYLCLTARSRIIDEHRVTKKVEFIDDPDHLDRMESTNAPFDSAIVERDYVSSLLSELTDDQRRVLEMRFIDDLSVEETAIRTGRSQGAVKGLQRRAINAILAAVAVVLAVLAIQALNRPATTGIDNGPAQPVETEDGDGDESGLPSIDDDQTGGDGDDGGALAVTGPVESAEADGGDPETTDAASTQTDAEGEGEGDSEIEVGGETNENQGGLFDITVGTASSSAFHDDGPVGTVEAHGVRVYCVASHFANGEPIDVSGRAGGAPAQLFWGNTAAAPSTPNIDLTAVGNGTCEGGVNDRSAYWMPTLFDDGGQAVIPDSILVELKSFGGPQFDRRTVQAMPAGLQLVAGPSVRNHLDSFQSVSGGASQVGLRIEFPSCLQVDQNGRPLLRSEDGVSHLSHRDQSGDPATGCPTSHPYRIPELTYKVAYSVPFQSDWTLAPGLRPSALTAGAIVAWDADSMDGAVRCVRELLSQCEFGVDEPAGQRFRSQLPERFRGPNGQVVYNNNARLPAEADRTPFGTDVPSALPR